MTAPRRTAPVEEVWKLLYDPARFPEWWEGMETVEPEATTARVTSRCTRDGYPDFPMPQQLRTDGDGRGVTVSCLVKRPRVRVAPGAALDAGTRIAVHVEIPEEEAHRLDSAARRNERIAALTGQRSPRATDAPPARG